MIEHENINFLPPDEHFEVAMSSLGEGQVTDWGLMAEGIPEAHKFTKGDGITVAVLDTGGSNHVDLNENVSGQYCTVIGSDNVDRQGHSTHCSGIIAAVDNSIGVIGVAPSTKILQIKVLGDNGVSGYRQIEDGIRLATTLKADIINMSLGASVEPPASFHQAIIDATNQGVIIVAAAGNDGGNVNFPARYQEVIATAAIDRNGNMANFSSRGEKVDFGAPGVEIYSTYGVNQYAMLSGTSQASPFIAGVCALILSFYKKHPEKGVINGYKDMLIALDKFANSDPNSIHFIKNGQFGYGIPKFANNEWFGENK